MDGENLARPICSSLAVIGATSMESGISAMDARCNAHEFGVDNVTKD
jgi:hypothetical protein